MKNYHDLIMEVHSHFPHASNVKIEITTDEYDIGRFQEELDKLIESYGLYEVQTTPQQEPPIYMTYQFANRGSITLKKKDEEDTTRHD